MTRSRKIALTVVFIWFFAGGIMHFIVPEFFLKIIPPGLPLRLEAVYLSGFFELAGALSLLRKQLRRAGGYGLIILTVAVTPANIYMWTHAHLFPHIPEPLLALRLILQVLLILTIWWAIRPHAAVPSMAE